VEHLFLPCPFAREVWAKVKNIYPLHLCRKKRSGSLIFWREKTVAMLLSWLSHVGIFGRPEMTAKTVKSGFQGVLLCRVYLIPHAYEHFCWSEGASWSNLPVVSSTFWLDMCKCRCSFIPRRQTYGMGGSASRSQWRFHPIS
jgi:hypothetical protein